ncbi:MAG: hypothetical protein H6850_03515 [Alphaproteobacteria bacterium]|nr:MAG: hypothetical protein H6850_03515 [Alphaproteobacteria bacterium]
MKVDRLCRKFERILDDNSSYDHGAVKSYCNETFTPNGTKFAGSPAFAAFNNTAVTSSSNTKTARVKDDDDSCSYGKAVIVGIIVGAVIAVLILFLNVAVSA